MERIRSVPRVSWRACRRLMPAGVLLLAACAGGYAGHGLVVGGASERDVVASMGEPAMRWQASDGSLQLAYPRGPEGAHTFMVHLGPDGRLRRIENVLVDARFAQVRPGDSPEDVLRLIGPPVPQWISRFPARDELVWEWLYCDGGNHLARFGVLFDGAGRAVRTTVSRPDYRGPEGFVSACGQVADR